MNAHVGRVNHTGPNNPNTVKAASGQTYRNRNGSDRSSSGRNRAGQHSDAARPALPLCRACIGIGCPNCDHHGIDFTAPEALLDVYPLEPGGTEQRWACGLYGCMWWLWVAVDRVRELAGWRHVMVTRWQPPRPGQMELFA